MSAKRFLDAVGHIDDELVAEFVERDMKMKPSPVLNRVKRLWWAAIPAVAACLALVTAIHYLMPILLRDPFGPPTEQELEAYMMAPWSPPKIGKDVPVLEIPAEPSGEPGLYNRAHYTTWHALAYVTDDFTFAPVPSYTEYLPIYAPPANLPERLPRRERLEAFVEKNLHVIRDMTVMPDLPYTVYDREAGENWPAESIAIFDGHSGEDDAFFQCVGDGGSPYLTVPAKALKNPEVFPHMGFGLSKEAVLAALEDTVLYLEEIFGVDWNYQSVSFGADLLRREFSVTLASVDRIRKDLPVELGVSYSHTLRITYECLGSNDYSEVYSIVYLERDYEEPVFSEIIGKAPMLTVAEAHAMIEQGYVYTGHGCSLCKAHQKNVSFNEYDRVTLTYLSGYAGKAGWMVPFYTFYRYSNTLSDGTRTYYSVSVPAVELSGLETYFAKLTEEHQHQ